MMCQPTDKVHVPFGVDVQIRFRWAAANRWSLWGTMVQVAPAVSSTFAASAFEACDKELPDAMEGEDHPTARAACIAAQPLSLTDSDGGEAADGVDDAIGNPACRLRPKM
jgi:hypothetical protein